jgi:DNA-binding transcriptional ArsR family regulator
MQLITKKHSEPSTTYRKVAVGQPDLPQDQPDLSYQAQVIQPDLKKLERDLSTIKNVTRLTILDILMASKEPLCFEDIVQKVGVNESNLAYHISQLRKYGFVVNELKDERQGKRFSYYHISDKGKKYMDFIHENMTEE